MLKKILLRTALIFLVSVFISPLVFSATNIGNLLDIYERISGNKPSVEVFSIALVGYQQTYDAGLLINDNGNITIIDYSLPSTAKRLWVINLKTEKTIYHTYVAHGKNSGELYATKFSNIKNSNQSSPGFFLTSEIYQGKNGLSLRLDGLEPGINDAARTRAIVMHGAWYANESMISSAGRLGRSFGCPAVPVAIHKELIHTIANGSLIFIYVKDEGYFGHSAYFKNS